jgi:cobalt-zinc-cadmium efflux system outer membrane protein
MYSRRIAVVYLALFISCTAISLSAEPDDHERPLRLTRASAVDIARENNPRVAAARETWRAAKAEHLVAISPQNPELEIEYEELSGIRDIGGFGQRNVGITQRIESPLKWWHRQRASGRRAESVRFLAFESARLAVDVDVKVAFDRVLANEAIVVASEESLRLAKDFASKARTRFEAGDVARLEALRARVQVGLAQNALAQAKAELTASRAWLTALLGRGDSTQLELEGGLTFEPFQLHLSDLKDLAASRRPDLQGSRQAVESLRSSRSEATASLMPDLNLGVARQTVAGGVARSSFWRLTLGFELPLWAPVRERGRLLARSAEVRGAEARLIHLEQKAIAEVESGYAALKANAERVEVFDRSILKHAAAAYDAASRSYQEGKASYLELLEAQRTLSQTTIDYTETLFDYRRAFAELERATGGSL